MLFIDSGAFLARHVERDQHHARAVAAWEQLRKRRERCFTSNFVLDEFFTLLARRTTYAFAADRARVIIASSAVAILRPAAEDELSAVDLFEKFADQHVSFTDCISFALMRSARIKRAFTFDRHFQDAGFDVWPK